MPIPLTVVDAFTDKPFRGNPAAVCLLEEALDRVLMQSIALEMNLSETAFVLPAENGQWQLRWFTPEAEVTLCGHATLAAAHVLYEEGRVAANEEFSFKRPAAFSPASVTMTVVSKWIFLPFLLRRRLHQWNSSQL